MIPAALIGTAAKRCDALSMRDYRHVEWMNRKLQPADNGWLSQAGFQLRIDLLNQC